MSGTVSTMSRKTEGEAERLRVFDGLPRAYQSRGGNGSILGVRHFCYLIDDAWLFTAHPFLLRLMLGDKGVVGGRQSLWQWGGKFLGAKPSATWPGLSFAVT